MTLFEKIRLIISLNEKSEMKRGGQKETTKKQGPPGMKLMDQRFNTLSTALSSHDWRFYRAKTGRNRPGKCEERLKEQRRQDGIEAVHATCVCRNYHLIKSLIGQTEMR